MQSEITGSYKHSNYNVLNQLRSATRIESEDGKNVKTYNYSYRYDEEGNQVEKVVSGNQKKGKFIII